MLDMNLNLNIKALSFLYMRWKSYHNELFAREVKIQKDRFLLASDIFVLLIHVRQSSYGKPGDKSYLLPWKNC